jgi:tRNA1(Val) A37 N6-methylase TrmN6
MIVNENERVDDLMLDGLKIIQRKDGFRFGTDSVLLSHFIKVKQGERIVDLCAGGGSISLLLAGRARAASFDLIEIQKDVCDMAGRSVELNQLSDRVRVHNMDIKDAPSVLGYGAFSTAVCNPPYDPQGSAVRNPDASVAIARHELLLSMSDVTKSASALLKNGGYFYMIQRANRFLQIADALRSERLEPKRAMFIQPFPGKSANLVLIASMKGANPGLVVEPVLVIRDEEGKITKRVERIYAGLEDL